MSAYEPYPQGAAASEVAATAPDSDATAPDFDATLASIWRRLWASLIDWSILIVIIVIGALIVASLTRDESTGSVLSVVFGLLVAALYAPLLLSRTGERNGQTLGKQLLRVRVVTREGGPVSFGRGCRREILGVLIPDTVTFRLYSLVDSPWALVDGRRQALHDKIGATYVVRADRPPAGPLPVFALPSVQPPPPPPPPAPPPAPRHDWQPPASADRFDEARRAFGD